MAKTKFSSEEIKEWSIFVENHPEGNIFHTPEFYFSFENLKNNKSIVEIYRNEENKICGVIIGIIQKSLFPPFSYFTRRTISFSGPIAINSDKIIIRELINRLDKSTQTKSIYTEFRNFQEQDISTIEIFKNANYEYIKHLNILVDTTIGIEQLWKGVKRNRKDGINKANKQGFVFEISNEISYIDKFYELLEETYKKVKHPYPPKDFFINLATSTKEYFKWFILKKDNKPIIILAGFDYKKTIYAYFIGISKDPKLTNLRPVDLFYWEVLKYGATNGCEKFDWMGAGKPDEEYGVREFKLQYGGTLLEMGRYQKNHNKTLYSLGLFGLKLIKSIK